MSSRHQSIPPFAKLVRESSRIRQQIVDLFRPSPEKLLLRSDVDFTPLQKHYRDSAFAPAGQIENETLVCELDLLPEC